jgi:HAD superfamily hydrolase (TIGR01509 family)
LKPQHVPRWIIFDLDGTLVETEEVWRDARRDFVTSHNGRWNDGAAATMIGMRTSEWACYIHEDLGVALPPPEIARLVVASVVDRLEQNLTILPGADAALERLAQSFRLGLATSAALRVAQTVLAKTGWSERFAVVVSADEVARGKPAPDVYLRALALLDADPARSAAVEDSANGIGSAHAARLHVVAIPNRVFPPDAAALALASRVIPNLDALNVKLIDEVLAT